MCPLNQVDMFMNKVDIACKAIKDWRAGKCGVAHAAETLRDLTPGEFQVVATFSRLTIPALTEILMMADKAKK